MTRSRGNTAVHSPARNGPRPRRAVTAVCFKRHLVRSAASKIVVRWICVQGNECVIVVKADYFAVRCHHRPLVIGITIVRLHRPHDVPVCEGSTCHIPAATAVAVHIIAIDETSGVGRIHVVSPERRQSAAAHLIKSAVAENYSCHKTQHPRRNGWKIPSRKPCPCQNVKSATARIVSASVRES